MAASFALTIKATADFFEADKILEKAGKEKARARKKAGAFVRRTARQKLSRKGKTPAKRGAPPRLRSPEPNLKTIYFVDDPTTDSLVVGPVLLRSSDTDPAVPGALEEGETIRTKSRGGRVVIRRLKPHPFMGPSLDDNVSKYPDLFKDLI